MITENATYRKLIFILIDDKLTTCIPILPNDYGVQEFSMQIAEACLTKLVTKVNFFKWWKLTKQRIALEWFL